MRGYLQENGQLAGNYPTEENASSLLQWLNVIWSQGRVRSAVSNGTAFMPLLMGQILGELSQIPRVQEDGHVI